MGLKAEGTDPTPEVLGSELHVVSKFLFGSFIGKADNIMLTWC